MAVDLSDYPDLVVIYLGMRVEEPRGYETLQRLGPEIQAAVEEQPDGLLLHENLLYSEEPLHTGMRQYWRDHDALEALDEDAAAQGLVDRLPARPRRNLVLARDLLPARRHRVDLRGHGRDDRAFTRRTRSSRRGPDVRGSSPRGS
jgi:hypothetical protein